MSPRLHTRPSRCPRRPRPSPCSPGCPQNGQPAAPATSAGTTGTATAAPAKATPAEAKAFMEKVNVDLKKLWVNSSTGDWIKNTYITDDTERNAALPQRGRQASSPSRSRSR